MSHLCRILSQPCSGSVSESPKGTEWSSPFLPCLSRDPRCLGSTGLFHRHGRAGLVWSLSAQSRISPTPPPPAVPAGFELLSDGFLCQESPAGSCSQGKVLP